jgi:hypothetical protein
VFVYQSFPVPVPRRRKRDEAAEEISSILQPNIHLHTHCDMFVTRILVPSIAAPVVCGGKHYLSDLDRQPSPLPAAQNTTPIVYSSNDDCTLHQPDGGYYIFIRRRCQQHRPSESLKQADGSQSPSSPRDPFRSHHHRRVGRGSNKLAVSWL